MVQTIAHPCPLAGRQAVYIARNLLRLVNDSIEYFDDAVGLQSGIYRNGILVSNKEQTISIIPNPASNIVTVQLKGNEIGICNITIVDVLGKAVIAEKLHCKLKSKTIDVSKLQNGIYTIKVKTESNLFEDKLIILK